MYNHPLVVSYGAGVDSTAVLVGLTARRQRPDLILFADTGSEKLETYAYLKPVNAWLTKVHFPPITVVKNHRPKSGDKSLYDACHRNSVLPALAYGAHQCSIVWKRDPQLAYVKSWPPAVEARTRGHPITFLIGYDAGPRDRCRSYKAEGKASTGTVNAFPLIEWGWDRDRCAAEIAAAGLPIPSNQPVSFAQPCAKPKSTISLDFTPVSPARPSSSRTAPKPEDSDPSKVWDAAGLARSPRIVPLPRGGA